MTSQTPHFSLGHDANSIRVVTFQLGDEMYCLGIENILRIIPMCPITKIPRQPDFMEGVANLRGDVIPIMDLRKRLGITPNATEKSQKVIVVQFREYLAGFIVDAVDEHTTFRKDQIKIGGDVLSGRSTEFIQGLIERDDGSLLMLLDPVKVLDSKQQESLNNLMEDHGI